MQWWLHWQRLVAALLRTCDCHVHPVPRKNNFLVNLALYCENANRHHNGCLPPGELHSPGQGFRLLLGHSD